MYWDELIAKSKYKTKTAWKIMKKETGNNNCHNGIKSLKFNNTISNNLQEIANTFNDYFLTVALLLGTSKRARAILGITWILPTI